MVNIYLLYTSAYAGPPFTLCAASFFAFPDSALVYDEWSKNIPSTWTDDMECLLFRLNVTIPEPLKEGDYIYIQGDDIQPIWDRVAGNYSPYEKQINIIPHQLPTEGPNANGVYKEFEVTKANSFGIQFLLQYSRSLKYKTLSFTLIGKTAQVIEDEDNASIVRILDGSDLKSLQDEEDRALLKKQEQERLQAEKEAKVKAIQDKLITLNVEELNQLAEKLSI